MNNDDGKVKINITHPIIHFHNQKVYPQDIAITTYAFSHDIPNRHFTIPPKGELKIAVNPLKHIPQYCWVLPSTKGEADFWINPTREHQYVNSEDPH